MTEHKTSLLALLQDAESTEVNLTELYRKMVGIILNIPRPNSHSTGHYVMIYTHPDGRTISPNFPAYAIVNGRENHAWGTWKPSGAVSGLSLFEQNSGEIIVFNPSRLQALVRHLAL